MRKVAVCIGLLLIAACVSQEGVVRDGETYGVTKGTFRGRWWSYYERGGSYLAGGFYEEAESDFRTALAQRGEDTWTARTYGMHFVEYFPNRELGVACYHLGRLDEAESYLQSSIGQVDTARAHFYLDEVKKAQIARGDLNDAQDPAVTASLADGAVVATPNVPLEIAAVDDTGVYAVKVNGRVLHQRGSAEKVTFEDELTLVEGAHQLEIIADDLAGKETAEAVTVNVDLTGPTVAVFEPGPDAVTQSERLTLRGAAVDRSGVASVRLADAVLAESAGDNRLAFAAEVPLANGENTFVLVARDAAGNETYSMVSVYRGNPRSAAAALWREQRLRGPVRTAAAGTERIVQILTSLTGAPEDEAIRIELRFPEPEQEYHKSHLPVKGTVYAKAAVSTLDINGQAIDIVPAEGQTDGQSQSFDRRVPLQIGDNLIKVAAADAEGHQAAVEVPLKAAYVAVEAPESRMAVAVLGFGGAADAALRESLRAQTETQVFETERFNVLDRIHLQDLLQEQELSAALGDPERALQLGKVVPANVFLVAEVIERGDEAEVYARAVDTETLRVVQTLDTHVPNKNDRDAVAFACDALAQRLKETFPRVSGEVLKVQGDKVLPNYTVEDGVREGMYILIVHQEEPFVDDATGEVLMEGEVTILGRARLTRVSDKASLAELVTGEGEQALAVEQGMPTITM